MKGKDFEKRNKHYVLGEKDKERMDGVVVTRLVVNTI